MNTPNYPRPPKRRAALRRCLPPLIAFMGILSAASALVVFGAYYRNKSLRTTHPLAMIRDPQLGEKLEVGQATTVNALARDTEKLCNLRMSNAISTIGLHDQKLDIC